MSGGSNNFPVVDLSRNDFPVVDLSRNDFPVVDLSNSPPKSPEVVYVSDSPPKGEGGAARDEAGAAKDDERGEGGAEKGEGGAAKDDGRHLRPCAICLGEMPGGKPVTLLECGHVFHSHCASMMLVHSARRDEERGEGGAAQIPVCPVCKKKYEVKERSI